MGEGRVFLDALIWGCFRSRAPRALTYSAQLWLPIRITGVFKTSDAKASPRFDLIRISSAKTRGSKALELSRRYLVQPG